MRSGPDRGSPCDASACRQAIAGRCPSGSCPGVASASTWSSAAARPAREVGKPGRQPDRDPDLLPVAEDVDEECVDHQRGEDRLDEEAVGSPSAAEDQRKDEEREEDEPDDAELAGGADDDVVGPQARSRCRR